MKTVFQKIYSIILSILIGWSVTNCGTTAATPTPPACKLLTNVYSSYPANSTTPNNTNTTTYTYNGELIASKIDTYISTGTSIVTNTANYAYDANGFVVSETLRSSVGNTTSTNNYTYANGRLTAVGTNRSYQYDANGNLTSLIAGTITKTYTGGVLTAITSSNAYPITTVQNGRVVRTDNSATFRTEHSYDAQGRLSETRLFSGGNLSNRSVYDYAPNIPPATSAIPAFKGAPTVPSDLGTAAYLLKTTQYNSAGAVAYTIDYVNVFNTRGYPTSITLNTTSNGSTTSQGTVNTYQDCQ
jgi:YD repeat-containing protein